MPDHSLHFCFCSDEKYVQHLSVAIASVISCHQGESVGIHVLDSGISEGNLDPFPKEAVICANDYESVDALLTRIREVDENDDLYLSMLAANPLRHPEFREVVSDFFARRRAFPDKIYDAAVLRNKSELGKRDRGMACFELSGRMVKILEWMRCTKMSVRTPFQEWWRGTRHLYFLRPGKRNTEVCPFRELSERSVSCDEYFAPKASGCADVL